MSGRFFKVICAAVLSIGLIGQANAGLIIGDVYTDGTDNWEYVGFFRLSDGLFWNDINDCDIGTPQPGCIKEFANAVNGIKAASEYFPTLTPDQIATSTVDDGVNHKAWYAEVGGPALALDEDVSVSGLYDTAGDISAFVEDGSITSSNADNYKTFVFKSVSVPAPSTLAIFALALCALGARKFKR
jgi:hypothetical protein